MADDLTPEQRATLLESFRNGPGRKDLPPRRLVILDPDDPKDIDAICNAYDAAPKHLDHLGAMHHALTTLAERGDEA